MQRCGWWTWLGLAVIATSAMLAVRGSDLAGRYLTPRCWRGFVLAVDGVLAGGSGGFAGPTSWP